MPKVEVLLRRIECHIAESVFVSSNQTSLNGFKTRATESNFIRFSFRFVESSFFRWFCFFINRHSLQRIGIPRSSCLSGLPFLIFVVFSHVLCSQFIILLIETSVAIARSYIILWNWLASNIIYIRNCKSNET